MRKHIIFKFSVVFFVITLPIVGYFTWQTFGSTIIGRTLNSNPDLQRGLVGHWTFDGKDMVGGTVFDTSSQGNNGVMVSMATSTAYVSGKIGQGLNFDGTDDYINAGNDTSLDVTNVTLNMWLKTESLPASTKDIVGKWDGASGMAYLLTILSSGDYKFFTGDGNSGNGVATLVTLGEWQMITGVYDGTNTKIYNNGVFVANASTPLSPDIITNSFFMGKGKSSGRFFAGTQDDVRIYNRALSASEVKRLYDLGATTKINVTLDTNPDLKNGLVGHWTFDGKDMVGGTVFDTSSQGNNGVMVSMATSTAYVPGKIGQGLNFDGVDDYVDTNIPDVDKPTGAMTLSAWIKGESNGTSAGSVMGTMGASGSRGFFFGPNNGGLFYFQIASNSTTVVSVSISGHDATVWTHYTAVYIPSTSLSIYRNGVFVDENTTSVPSSQYQANSISLKIGQRGDNWSTARFTGPIDDVRIYDRALSASEIKRLYHLGATTKTNVTLNTNSELKNGLVGYWTFDGKDITTDLIVDRSGNGNHGGFMGGATTTAGVPGKIGQALNFDGVDDKISFGVLATIDQIATGTISAWIKLDTLTNNRLIFAKENVHSYRGIQLYINTSGKLELWYRDASIDYLATGSTVMATGKWYHVVMISTGTVYKMYINGVENTVTGTNTGNWFADNQGGLNDTADYVIGTTIRSGNSNYMDGSEDDVRIYNRVLSASEIKRLYDLGR